MIFLSLSENNYRFAQVIQDEEGLTTEIVWKNDLAEALTQDVVFSDKFVNTLKSIFNEIKNKVPVPDTEVALSIPSSWTNITINKLEQGFETKDIATVSSEQAMDRFGPMKDKFFIQTYPLADNNIDNENNLLTISYQKELGKNLIKAANPFGYSIALLDIDIFSAANAVIDTERPDYSEWGIWKIAPNGKENIVMLVDDNEVVQYIEFIISDGKISITQNTGSRSRAGKLLHELMNISQEPTAKIQNIKKIYVYCNSTESELFNIILNAKMENLAVIDPLQGRKIINLYDGDGSSLIAMSQYLDLAGMISRYNGGGFDD